MKLCKNCNYVRLPTDKYGIAKCSHPTALINNDFVFGYKVFWSAAAMRNSTEQNTCGTSAQYYEEISTGAKPQ